MDVSGSDDGARFTTVRAAEGYDIAEVDAFLGHVEAALVHDPPVVTAEDVADKQFTPVRFGNGYKMSAVDSFLDELAADLRRRQVEAARAASPTVPSQSGSGQPTYTSTAGLEERGSTQPLWVRLVAVLAIVALLAFVAAQVL